MKIREVLINRKTYWLVVDNIRIETDELIEELENQITCFYSSKKPNDLFYGTQVKDDTNNVIRFKTAQEAIDYTVKFLENNVYPPDFLRPLSYRKENISEIMNKTLLFDIGLPNDNQVTETIKGILTECTMAAYPPHLPANVTIETLENQRRTFSFFEIKRIYR